MKVRFLKMIVAAFVVCAAIGVTSCGPSKDEKLKYNNDLVTLVDKADSTDTQISKKIEPLMQNPSMENYAAAMEEVSKLEAALKTGKTSVAAIPTPKFEEFNLKSSCEKWFDAEIASVSNQKQLLDVMVKAIKAQIEVNNAGGAEAAPAELQEAAAKLAQETSDMVKKIEANETTSKTLREEFRANATQFTTKHGLK